MKEDTSKSETSEVQFKLLLFFFLLTSAIPVWMNCVKCEGVLYYFQSERKEILRRLNHNLKAYPSKEEGEQETAPLSESGPAPQPCQPVTDERPQSGGDRRRWETGAPPVLSVAQYTLEDTCSTMAGTNGKSELQICRHRFEYCVSFLHSFLSLLSVSQTASSEASPVSGGDRKKWQPADVLLAVAQQTLEDTSIATAGKFLPVHADITSIG